MLGRPAKRHFDAPSGCSRPSSPGSRVVRHAGEGIGSHTGSPRCGFRRGGTGHAARIVSFTPPKIAHSKSLRNHRPSHRGHHRCVIGRSWPAVSTPAVVDARVQSQIVQGHPQGVVMCRRAAQRRHGAPTTHRRRPRGGGPGVPTIPSHPSFPMVPTRRSRSRTLPPGRNGRKGR